MTIDVLSYRMIKATLALLGCVGGDWMIRGGVARKDRSADKSEEVMAALDGCVMVEESDAG